MLCHSATPAGRGVSVLLVLMKRYHELTAVTQTENCIASLTENAAAITRNDSNCKYSTVVNFPNKHCHMNAKKIIVILCPKKLNLLFF